MTVIERVAYVKGLADGMELDGSKKEGKLLRAMIEVLEELAEEVTELEQESALMRDELDEAYFELEKLQGIEDLDDALYEVVCPTCGEEIYLDDDLLSEGSMACPACGEELEFDLSDLTDDDIVDSLVADVAEEELPF